MLLVGPVTLHWKSYPNTIQGTQQYFLSSGELAYLWLWHSSVRTMKPFAFFLKKKSGIRLAEVNVVPYEWSRGLSRYCWCDQRPLCTFVIQILLGPGSARLILT
jgi:hypothetical protein